MYDYSEIEPFKIENVDHEIHILGVKPTILPVLLYIFIICMFMGSFLGEYIIFFGLTLMMVSFIIANRFFNASQKGLPYEYRPLFHLLRNKIPLFEEVFFIVKHIEHQPNKKYVE